MMKIVVVGAGAVGGYFGGRLAKAGYDVTFLARGEHAKAIHHTGLAINSIQGDFRIFPAEVADSLATIGPVDLVLFNVAKRMGVHIESDYVDTAVAFIDSFPSNATSSLTRDVWEGKPSEIEYQNGTVVRLAKEYRVAAPVNTFVYSCILPMEKKARTR